MGKKKKPAAKEADNSRNPPEPMLPDVRAIESAMWDIVGGMDEETREATPLDCAQELMYRAFEASGREQVRLARKALEISPDCADAYVLLAEHARSADEALKHYEQGVAAGERAIGPEAFAEYAGQFWGFLETRPYMRAREGLAQCLWAVGRRDEAVEHYRAMLRLNPNDNQGIRYLLATLLLDMDGDEELRQLLRQYEDDSSAEWAYADSLLAFREGGDSPRSRQSLAQAVKVNKHVPAYLLGHKPLPQDLPPYITPGGNDEAVSYAVGNRRAWLNTPGAISWLRTALDLPMPKAPKPRRPAWSALRQVLQRLPQDHDEVWEVDAIPSRSDDGSPAGGESRWTVVIASRSRHELLCLDAVCSPPKPTVVWDRLADTIRQPSESDPRRPARIEVRQPAFHKAWNTKLRQIGIECVLADTLDVVDEVQEQLHGAMAADSPRTSAAPSTEDILALPQAPAEVWQADVRPMPGWIMGEGRPYRPWMAMVVSRTEGTVLAHQLSPALPPAAWLGETILQAIGQPRTGDAPHRPGTIEVGSAAQREALSSILDRAGIACVVPESLEQLDAALAHLADHMAGQGAFPAVLGVPGMELAQVGSFYAVAADFYRRKPWQQVSGDTPIKVECDKFQSGPWYAVVMGQSGVQQGVALYEDLAALQGIMTSRRSEEENARGMSALSLMFSEAFEIPVRDLDAAEKYGWPVAGPEAYPLVIRINPGHAVRPPLVWELQLLNGCLQTIPEFLASKGAVLEKTVAAVSAELAMRLSWIEEG